MKNTQGTTKALVLKAREAFPDVTSIETGAALGVMPEYVRKTWARAGLEKRSPKNRGFRPDVVEKIAALTGAA